MQILITNDDGPGTAGLQTLRQAVQGACPAATIVTLTMDQWLGGQGMSVSCCDIDTLPIYRVASDTYICPSRPADLVYLALGRPRRFLPVGEFDLLLCGINHGQNVGMDVFHSGTVGMAMLASTFYGVPAIAFSQQLPREARPGEQERIFKRSERLVQAFLSGVPLLSGECLNVNLPAIEPLGWKVCGVALQSRFRPLNAGEVRIAEYDVPELQRGYITVSSLQLGRITPPPSEIELNHVLESLSDTRICGAAHSPHK